MTKRTTVLIVDDDDIFLTIIESMILSIGYPVIKARDGLEALSMYQDHASEIGCVVLDIQMPKMNGITAFEHLRKLEQDLKVIIASGVLNSTNRQRLTPLQPSGFLEKPVSFQELSSLLNKCISSRSKAT